MCAHTVLNLAVHAHACLFTDTLYSIHCTLQLHYAVYTIQRYSLFLTMKKNVQHVLFCVFSLHSFFIAFSMFVRSSKNALRSAIKRTVFRAAKEMDSFGDNGGHRVRIARNKTNNWYQNEERPWQQEWRSRMQFT